MTTVIVVAANQNCPVRVTQITRAIAGGATSEQERIVPAGARETFFIFNGCDLHLQELPLVAPPASPPLDE